MFHDILLEYKLLVNILIGGITTFNETLYSLGNSNCFRIHELYEVKDGILYIAPNLPYDSRTIYNSLDEINRDLKPIGVRFIVAGEDRIKARKTPYGEGY